MMLIHANTMSSKVPCDLTDFNKIAVSNPSL